MFKYFVTSKRLFEPITDDVFHTTGYKPSKVVVDS